MVILYRFLTTIPHLVAPYSLTQIFTSKKSFQFNSYQFRHSISISSTKIESYAVGIITNSDPYGTILEANKKMSDFRDLFCKFFVPFGSVGQKQLGQKLRSSMVRTPDFETPLGTCRVIYK